jgi:hypothetical protein
MSLVFDLNNGYLSGSGERELKIKTVPLLRLNGVAEKIITTRLPEKPYTYMAYILAASIESLEGIPIAAKCRKEYSENGRINIPNVLLDMPLGEVATCLVEIHRLLWKNTIKDQKGHCSHCGGSFTTDIELDRITLRDSEMAKIVEFRNKIVVDLPEGWSYTAPTMPNGRPSEYIQYEGMTFNKMEFKVPTLRNAIQHEKLAPQEITFWRQVARVTLERVYNESNELPAPAFLGLGTKLYDEVLYTEDLLAIREGLRDSIPALTFFYMEECPYCHNDTPVTLEGNNFFPS